MVLLLMLGLFGWEIRVDGGRGWGVAGDGWLRLGYSTYGISLIGEDWLCLSFSITTSQ